MIETALPAAHGSENTRTFARQLRAREPRALERLFDLYFDVIYGWVRATVHDTRQAEQLTHAIFMSIHRKLPALDPTVDLGAWIHALVARCLNEHRLRGREPVAEVRADDTAGPAGGPREHDGPPQVEPGGALERALQRLPIETRSVLFLRVYDNLSFRSIATLLKLTPAAARKLYSRAVDALRPYVPRLGGEL